MTLKRFHFIASDTSPAQAARAELSALYGDVGPHAADILIILGGDGTMLHALHTLAPMGKPVYGLNCGHVGFLMNPYDPQDLHDRVLAAEAAALHPLRLVATDVHGTVHQAHAYNEVSVYRQTRQSAHLRIDINGQTRLDHLIGDGILAATPAGSTAYNLSVRGPIIPLGSNVMALTPISPFRPRGWRCALLPQDAKITIHNLDTEKRPVSVTADFTEFPHVKSVHIEQDLETTVTLLFNPDHQLDDRILSEQFA